MSPLLFPTLDLPEKEVGLITEVYHTLKPGHPDAAFDFDFQPQLSNFESITGYYTDNRLGPALRLDTASPHKYLCFLNLTYRGLQGKYTSGVYTEYQTWGVSFLKGDYGHILIRPETTLDKIRELLHHAELDFEDDKAFSSRFYVLANDEGKARILLGPAVRQKMLDLQLKDFTLEIIDNMMIIGDNKCIDPATAGEIASFLYKLS